LHDNAAMGSELRPDNQPTPDEIDQSKVNEAMIERRYTKPCARFLNGVRVGFGFRFERTCRPWNCEEHCGDTDNLFHRQCRLFEFKKHQQVILRSPEALKREEEEAGHVSGFGQGQSGSADGQPVDSYEGFRSDYIHFSVSVVAPLNEVKGKMKDDAENQNSLHMSPKAFAHFFAWWK
jgi:hypothetical protein